MEFLYLLGGLIALLLGTDTATKGLSGLVQQAGASALTAALVLVGVGYALPGLALVVGVLVWAGLPGAAAAAQGAMLGSLGLAAAGLLISTGLVLRVRPWRMLDGDKAEAELAEFAASREGWGRNLFRLGLAALLLVLGARGVWAGAPWFAPVVEGLSGLGPAPSSLPLVWASTVVVGAAVGIVATFNARFGDAAAAYAAILGGGLLLVLVATTLVLVNTGLASLATGWFAHPLLHGAILLGVLAAIARPGKPIGRGAGALALLVTVLLAALAAFGP